MWEWTRSLWGKGSPKPTFAYPYKPTDGREDLTASNDTARVVRGGSFDHGDQFVRAANRLVFDPVVRDDFLGFRVVVSRSRS